LSYGEFIMKKLSRWCNC